MSIISIMSIIFDWGCPTFFSGHAGSLRFFFDVCGGGSDIYLGCMWGGPKFFSCIGGGSKDIFPIGQTNLGPPTY